MLHGWTMAGDIFDALRAAMPDVTCLAPDLPGHGAAGYPPTISGGAQMLADLLAEGPAVVAGWSMGALVAWDCIADHNCPNLRGLVTIDMSPRPLPDWEHGLSGLTPESARAQTARFAADWTSAAWAMASAMFAGSDGAPGLGRKDAALRIAGRDPSVMLPFWNDMLARDHRGTVATLTRPYLALHGAASRVYPSGCAEWLAKTAPQGRAVIMPDVGHAPILEAPQACADVLGAFLKDLS